MQLCKVIVHVHTYVRVYAYTCTVPGMRTGCNLVSLTHSICFLQELQRALDMERSERQSAEAKTLQLLAEVREFHEKIVKLKEAKAK